MSLVDIVKQRTEQSTGLTKEQLQQMINEDDRVLHDPFLYDGMSELVNRLHAFKERQKQDHHQLLVIDTDYDTDGVMSAAVLSAALDVFNINYRIYIPSMADGYGLSPKAVREMKQMFERNNNHIGMILTADNGTNAIAGVDEANAQGIEVLVSDHHLSNQEYSKAAVIVNPNKTLPDGNAEPYPFKGNSGAAVAWKVMMAYAMRYDAEALPLIHDLIVFAGIANVSDVMPIVDENHYMVKLAVKEIQRLVSIRSLHSNDPWDNGDPYKEVKDTPYLHYNTVFYGLYDMLELLQKSKDDKREANHKKPIPLSTDEELIGWYLSPMINAPRRIHATSKEAMLALMATRLTTRQENITSMIQMNEVKSELCNEITSELNWDLLRKHNGNVLFVNAQHGISGLVAGQIVRNTGKAAIVFALPTSSTTKLYGNHDFDSRFDADELVIGSSARSTASQPLNVIMARIKEIRPNIIVGGGGHAQAAGYTIRYKYLDQFETLFDNVAKQVEDEIVAQYNEAVAKGEIQPAIQNMIKLSFYDGKDTPEYAWYNVAANSQTLLKDMMTVISLQSDLRPFGKDFDAQTQFQFDIDPMQLLNPEYNLNLNFWKTLKFNLYGVDVLTFNIELADLIKDRIEMKNPAIITANAKLTLNEFRGRVTPQLQLDI